MLASRLRLGSLWLCPPHAGKDHCFRGLTLSHTPHYGCWMGPGGVISGRHLRFSALITLATYAAQIDIFH